MKGIILAGGNGTRLFPMTKSVSKQILPIYDKPMIYYPLSCLMLAGIKDIMIISTPRDLPVFYDLLGTGKNIGMNFEYKVQEEPKGIAQAFLIAEEYIKDESVALVLGDNIFYGTGLASVFNTAREKIENQANKAIIFAYYVENPKDFGVVEFDKNKKAKIIEEKPEYPKSHYAVPGIYFYDNNVVEISKSLKPSTRGELEISSINQYYLERNLLNVELLGRGIAWLDTGTSNGLMQAAAFVEVIQKRTGMYIACIEEIAWRKGFISTEQLIELGNNMRSTDYGKYLMKIPFIEESREI